MRKLKLSVSVCMFTGLDFLYVEPTISLSVHSAYLYISTLKLVRAIVDQFGGYSLRSHKYSHDVNICGSEENLFKSKEAGQLPSLLTTLTEIPKTRTAEQFITPQIFPPNLLVCRK